MGAETAERSAQVLVAELGAALPARRSAVEFARHFIGERDPALKQDLIELRSAEARLEASLPSPLDNAAVLARMAVHEAQAIEAEAALLQAGAPAEAAADAQTVRLVAGLLWEARLGEGRTRAYLSARRRHEYLPGFDEALDFAPENELLFLALRRFSRLLHGGGAWPKADLDWLRLRAATLPGRLSLRAVDLRGAAENATGIAPPEAMQALRLPFLQFGFEPAAALAWGVAGFGLGEALVWGAAGLPWASQALAWRRWGFDAKEAAAWAAADLLPDEAAAFKACGAQDPATARELRQSLGDVEQLLAWHRAGFGTAEVLRLRREGVRDVDSALKARLKAHQAPPPAPVAPAPALAAPTPAPAAPTPAPAAPTPVEVVPASTDLPSEAAEPPGSELPAGIVNYGAREKHAKTAPEAPAAAPAPAAKRKPAVEPGLEGGAWLGWGAFEAGEHESGKPQALARSRRLGSGTMDLVNASEGVALLTFSYERSDLVVEPDWQSLLDAHRQTLGRAPQAGSWQLMALSPMRARLYWGLHFKTTVSPWGRAIDFDPAETWQQRWKRKVEEWGEPGLAPTCEVGRTPAGGWYLMAPGSQVDQAGDEPRILDVVEAPEAWVEGVERFCLIMGLGKQDGAWQLLAVDD